MVENMITGRYDRWLKPKHKFKWECKGKTWCEVLGASEKEAEEILAQAIKNWLAFQTRPLAPYPWPCPGGIFRFLDW
jgi:hypothetical protein